VFNGEPVELLEESTWTARLRRTDIDTCNEVLCFLEFGDASSECYQIEHRSHLAYTRREAVILAAMSSDVEKRMLPRAAI